MPFYNGNQYVNQALESVKGQAFVSIEVVLCVDKGSEALEIDPKFVNLVRVVENTTAERGAGIARYVAISHAKFRYLAFLDCDDLWDPQKIEKQLKSMKRNDFGFCFSGYRNFKGDMRGRDYIPRGNMSLSGFLSKRFTVGCLTVMIDRMHFDEFRPIPAKRRNDYRMWFDVLSKLDHNNVQWGAVPEALASHRMHRESLTASPVKSLWSTFLFYRDCGFSRMAACGLIFMYVARTLFRRFVMTARQRLSVVGGDSSN